MKKICHKIKDLGVKIKEYYVQKSRIFNFEIY